MSLNVSQKLIKSHLVEGEMIPENEIGILIDQTLTQDATGTLVMLELDSKELTFTVRHTLTPRLVEILFAGGLTNRIRHQSLVTA